MKKFQITEAQKEVLEKMEGTTVLAATIIAVGVALSQAANALTEAKVPEPELPQTE